MGRCLSFRCGVATTALSQVRCLKRVVSSHRPPIYCTFHKNFPSGHPLSACGVSRLARLTKCICLCGGFGLEQALSCASAYLTVRQICCFIDRSLNLCRAGNLFGMAGKACSRPMGLDCVPGEEGSEGVRGVVLLNLLPQQIERHSVDPPRAAGP